MAFKISDVYNNTDSQLTVKNRIGTINEVIASRGKKEKIDTHINELSFKVQSKKPIVFEFIKRNAIDDHIDVKVGHPDDEPIDPEG